MSALLLALPVGAIVVFYLIPSASNLYYGFTDWSTFHTSISFTGFDNFREIWKNGSLGNTLKVTLTYAVAATIFLNILALGTALLLEERTRLNVILRAVLFIPVLISPLAAGFLFSSLLAPSGIVNAMLSALWPWGKVEYPWLGDPTYAIVVLAAIHAWKYFGVAMMVYIAGLQTIPSDLVEAARIDGARGWATFRHVKMPLLAPAVTFSVVTALVGALQTPDLVFATTNGGPGTATQVLNYLLYQEFAQGFFGSATAVSMVTFAIVIFASVPLIVFLRRREVVI
jgi:raffinose/stachyose/melibiose transport system permease protein